MEHQFIQTSFSSSVRTIGGPWSYVAPTSFSCSGWTTNAIEGDRMMRIQEHKADIVISVSGGIVNGVFGPEGATVLVIDFDNIRVGDGIGVTETDGNVNSKDCIATIKEAVEIVAKRESGCR